MKKALAALLVAILLGIGGWYYMTNIHAVPIGKLLDNPREYAGKEISIAGTVSERLSLFVVKYFNLQDETGTIAVVSERPLPEVGRKVRIRGHLEEGFSLGDQQVLVFVESNPR